VDWCAGTVDGELLEVGTAVAVELSVEVGEETALEKRVLGEVDAADDVARLELRKLVLLAGDNGTRRTMTCSVSAK
jgi:hypothetical protein